MKKERQMELIFSGDPYRMNWLRPDYEYGRVKAPKELTWEVENRREGDVLYTEIRLTNPGKKPYFADAGSIGIAFPLPDSYEDARTCLARRCHTHIFCGRDVSYICALRMGGQPPHLGMVLTEGSLECYSVERNLDRMSNDRGCFLLHPGALQFDAGETKRISWKIFPHQGKEDFLRRLGEESRFVDVRAERYVLFPDEKISLRIRPAFPARTVTVNGDAAVFWPEEGGFQPQAGVWLWEADAGKLGEKWLNILADGVETRCRILVQERPDVLSRRRCQFLARKQQYQGKVECLRGAYLIYDNEGEQPVYRPENDFNGGRERMGMGCLMARFLQMEKEQEPEDREMLEKSLDAYRTFVLRELVDAGTGAVCDDIGMDGSFRRLYNPPWGAVFFMELYRKSGRREDLACASQIVRRFYQDGGAEFYPIGLPICQLVEELKKAGWRKEEEELTALFLGHADRMLERGTDYPASEVNYEQSIVAPAADILLSAYLLSGEEKYLRAGEEQLAVLELFNGFQPDWHLYETAIRHWDGYWFGKRRIYGDTFPHYWSVLTGNVFELYGRITKDPAWLKRAEDSRRGVLGLIFPDGRASCACVFPHTVNGVRGEFFDEYANDQDWGLYYYLRDAERIGDGTFLGKRKEN